MYKVYMIKCSANNRAYYGRSQEYEKRWRAHKNMLRTGSHYNTEMQKDWNQYGEENFMFIILNSFDSLEDSIICEQHYIDNRQPFDYNISNSINGGDTFTNNPNKDRIRELKSLNSTGIRNPMYGKPKSEHMIRRVKEANSKSIFIEGKTYNSITEASHELGIGITTVSYRLNSVSERFREWKYCQ